MAKDTTPKKRAARPAGERAQEALDTANRVLAAARKRLIAAQARVTEIQAEIVQLEKRRDYAALSPDLSEQPADEPSPTDTPVEA